MSGGMKKNIQGQLHDLKDQLQDEHRRELRLIGSYKDRIANVRDFAEHLKREFGLRKKQKVYGNVFYGASWAHHHRNDTTYPHTDVTDDHEQRLINDLWALVRYCGVLNSGSDSDSDSDYNDSAPSYDDGFANAFSNMRVY